jgi:hypothetical protein
MFRCSVLVAAMVVGGWPTPTRGAGIVTLNASDPDSFYIYGGATLNAGGASVQVNSSAAAAALFQGGSFQLTAGAVNVVGGFQTSGRPALSLPINVGQPSMPDPFGHLPAPAVGAPAGPPKITGSGTFHPGYYPQGLDLVAGNDITLMPGVYVLDNGFHLSGDGALHGDGVMFYIRSGALHDNGTGDIFLAPPTDGPYAGISFQARDNANFAAFNGMTSFTGARDAAGIGTLYFPAATVEFGGIGDIDVNGIVADKVEAYGLGVTRVIVPEPSTVGLLAVAGAGLMTLRVRRSGRRRT